MPIFTYLCVSDDLGARSSKQVIGTGITIECYTDTGFSLQFHLAPFNIKNNYYITLPATVHDKFFEKIVDCFFWVCF